MSRHTVLFLSLAICPLAAAPSAAQPRTSVFVNVNVALQEGAQNLAVSVPATVFEEDGTIDIDSDIDGDVLGDIYAGLRAGRLAIGVGYFQTSVAQSHQFSASTTPFSPGSFRRSLNAVTASLEHAEKVFYIGVGAVKQATEKFDAVVSAGPAFFRVTQEVPETISQGPPPRGDYESMETRTVEESAFGFHGALDLNYLFHPRIGIGGVIRFMYGSVDLPDGTESMKVGGFSFGAGARIRF